MCRQNQARDQLVTPLHTYSMQSTCTLKGRTCAECTHIVPYYWRVVYPLPALLIERHCSVTIHLQYMYFIRPFMYMYCTQHCRITVHCVTTAYNPTLHATAGRLLLMQPACMNCLVRCHVMKQSHIHCNFPYSARTQPYTLHTQLKLQKRF